MMVDVPSSALSFIAFYSFLEHFKLNVAATSTPAQPVFCPDFIAARQLRFSCMVVFCLKFGKTYRKQTSLSC